MGIGIGGGSNGAGLSIFANMNAAGGKDKGNGTVWSETTIDSGKTVTIDSGRDTVLNGAQVSGNKIVADVGHDLLISSQQDSNDYYSKQNSVAAGGSFTFGSMSGSGYLSASQDKMKSTYDAVQEQTGIYAGSGGFDVKVGEHTQLDGAVIASTAGADKNRLETGTLGWRDIRNEADYNVSHSGISLSGGGSFGGDQFKGNMPGGMLSGGSHSGHEEGTTQAAVAEGSIVIRDPANQTQDVAALSRDTEQANDTVSPIFDKEKEQNRLKGIGLIGEIGAQAMDIARTQGEIAATNAGRAELEKKGIREPGAGASKEAWADYNKQLVATEGYKAAQQRWGTGSAIQQGIQAATAALQGLAGGNIAQAVSGAAAPYLAEQIHKLTEGNPEAKAMAHAVVGAVTSYASGNGALAGAAGAVSGELMAQLVMKQLYPGKEVSELTETEKQTVSTLGTLAAGLAGGVTGGSTADAVAGAQAGKNAVENNFLGATSSDRLDKAVEKIKQGDKSLAAANELLTLENADKRSDALVDKFTRDPSQMSSTERAELAGYLRVYASEMDKAYGPAVAQELVKGLLSGQDYIKRNPDSEAMASAQKIMNTWGYHKSNASIGDAPLIFGGSVLGLTVKGMATNAAIGVGVNTGVQLAGQDPFSYVDAIMAGVTAAATTGKGIIASTPINMGGAAIGSGFKGEEPLNSMAGAAAGTVVGGLGGEIIKGVGSKLGKDAASDLTGAVLGGYIGEKTGNAVKDELDKKDKTDAKK